MGNVLFSPLNLATISFIAVAYTSWSFLGKYLGVSGPWLSAVVILGTFVGTIISGSSALLSTSAPSVRHLAFLLIAGCVNGVAVYLASEKMVNPLIPSAAFSTILLIIMVVLAPLISWVLHGDVPTNRQLVGVAITICGVYFLKP